MEVRIALESDKARWDAFVDQEQGSFHLYYNWKYYYEDSSEKNRFIPLLIENDASEILGIFPVVDNTQLAFGFLTSLPSGVSDGFLIKSGLNEQEKSRIIQSFLDYVDSRYSKTHALISIKESLRFSEPGKGPTKILTDNGFEWLDNSATKLPCTHVLFLEKPFGEIFRNISTRMRRRLRHAGKSGATVITDHDLTYFTDFVDMQIRMVKKFGITAKKEDYLRIRDNFRDRMKLFVCLVDSRPVSALLCYYTPTTVYTAVGPYRPEARAYLNYSLPMCAAIRDGCESGHRYFCMGFVHTRALSIYKERFGTTTIPVRTYTKKFSGIKSGLNKTHQYIRWGGKIAASLW